MTLCTKSKRFIKNHFFKTVFKVVQTVFGRIFSQRLFHGKLSRFFLLKMAFHVKHRVHIKLSKNNRKINVLGENNPFFYRKRTAKATIKAVIVKREEGRDRSEGVKGE